MIDADRQGVETKPASTAAQFAPAVDLVAGEPACTQAQLSGSGEHGDGELGLVAKPTPSGTWVICICPGWSMAHVSSLVSVPGRIVHLFVAGSFTLAQLALVPPEMGLGWDETVYVSQVSPHAPAAFFSAPRARGVPLLVAPVAAWSSSTVLLRVYLALLAGLGLYLALRACRGLFLVRVLALAGALFTTLWVTLFYGPQAMPN
ncbi:hypothetical protein SGFS_032510 [Streptomyces graminofaciens]|uniref:Integral membrane protein n=1 Tax=Streptomyces graminofaciens TaxID=68212 RepID=A0ABN5VFB6_9ACTN|nr:hypothetical protein SGFS_032510 [Streptomyces graminofaciens]